MAESCVSMTGRRRTSTRSTFLPRSFRFSRSVRATALSAGALAACASLAVACGVVPGTAGGSGDGPIVVMTWAPEGTSATNKPGMPAFARAYARWLNANGGLGGRDLKVLTCNDRDDTVAAAQCARRAVKEGAVAVVGSYSQHSDAFFPHLEGAGIPYIGGFGVTNAEFTSPLSYPVNGGRSSLLAGLGKELAPQCGRVSLVRPDTIAGDSLPVMLDAGLTAGGHDASSDQPAPEDATEYTDQAEDALRTATKGEGRSRKGRGCVVTALGDRTGTFMDSFRRSRDDYPGVRTATILGSVDQTVINAAGAASGPFEGAYVTGWYPVASDPAWAPMKKVISEKAFSDTRIDPADTGVQTTWIAYNVLRQAVESLDGGPVTADTVRHALDGGLRIDTGGLTPPLRWRFTDRLASIGFPRLVNADVTLQTVRKGRLVAAERGFVDVTGTLEKADVD
ncbi:ABC-type branched-subunit amino acid transport system substrate-binding protein [Streptomyces achromogenes]|uniref:ABC-type branched-subunit amino acid transport system substrate-binding protein n=2 Tax=Streptomyces achromogenes TaxID=67255 RepID=A0ABU0Q1J8_STRAH|nr:ABC-type branched-subunit amino acid transport system substrate-binding protein [Streptomyces achromogenes]